MDDVRIQIVNYRTKAYLVTCLQSLFGSLDAEPIAYTVAVLDNASGDDLSDLPALFPHRALEVHHAHVNRGFGAGHNALACHGRARYLWLLNPDTQVPEPATLQRLVRRAAETGAQVIGPRLYTEGGRTQVWDHGELDGWLARCALASGNSYWRARHNTTPAAWVSGAALLIETAWFDRVGGFDEGFFLYKEEEELCWRLRAAGGRVVYEPGLAVFHHVGVVSRKSAHLYASTEYFLRKHFRHRIDYPLLRLLNRLLH
jgi:GT2 family glycosyltransferase